MASDNVPKRMVVQTITRRVAVMDAMLSKFHLDRHTLINQLIKQWVLSNLDDDELVAPVSRIFDTDDVSEAM